MRYSRIFALSFVLLLFGVGNALALSVKTGQFTSGTAGGSMTITHNLGVTPKFLILWGTYGLVTNDSVFGAVRFFVGITDGTNQYSYCIMINNGKALPTNSGTSLRGSLVTLCYSSGSSYGEAVFSSWNATDFTINWTKAPTADSMINYLIVGGEEVSAKVIAWTTPTVTGNKSVTGVGFQPDVVLNVFGDRTAIPQSTNVLSTMGTGVMDKSGSRWASAIYNDSSGSTVQAWKYQRTDKAIALLNASNSLYEADFVSMDTDGFTLNFNEVGSSAYYVISLALKGVKSKIGSFLKTTASAPTTQQVTGIGFTPKFGLIVSYGEASSTVSSSELRYSWGWFSDTLAELSICGMRSSHGVSTISSVGVISNTLVWCIKKGSAVLTKAEVSDVSSDSFTMSYSVNDTGQDEILYMVLGEQPAQQRKRFFIISKNVERLEDRK